MNYEEYDGPDAIRCEHCEKLGCLCECEKPKTKNMINNELKRSGELEEKDVKFFQKEATKFINKMVKKNYDPTATLTALAVFIEVISGMSGLKKWQCIMHISQFFEEEIKNELAGDQEEIETEKIMNQN
jgi:hypothetical protein